MRLIVPDTSVLLPAFFPEKLKYRDNEFDLSSRARPISRAIRAGVVRGVAPDMLVAEFLKGACAIAFDRVAGPGADEDLVRSQVLSFLSLPFTRIPAERISAIASDLAISERVPPPDTWFLAAAIHADAELWYSHRHEDGIVEHAEHLHRGKVFTLTERPFSI